MVDGIFYFRVPWYFGGDAAHPSGDWHFQYIVTGFGFHSFLVIPAQQNDAISSFLRTAF